jgi:peptide/nickel transport system substrate-binding protein
MRPSVFSRRQVLRSVVVTAGASLVAACGIAPSAPPTTSVPTPASLVVTPRPTAVTSLQPRGGGTLRVGILGDIPSLDPHQLTVPVPDVTYSIWDRLLAYDAQLKLQPLLAETFDMSSDGKQLKLTLRKGVQFHTGREFTSDDVKWTLNRLKTDPIVAVTGFYTQIGPMSSVETTDKYTVVLKSDDPWPGVFDLLALMSVVDSVTMQGPNAKTQPVGTGPFTFGEWVQGDHLRLVKNKNYWQPGRPYLDEINFQIFNDPQAMVTALEAGAIDVANKPPLVDAARLKQDAKYKLLIAETGGTRFALFFNVLAPPTDNQRFRQAMLYAIDRQRIVDSVMKGIGTPTDLPFAVGSPAYDATRDSFYAFNLDKARSLVAESGVSSPTLDFNYSAVSKEWAGIGQIYQSDLTKIGVTLNLKPLDPVALNSISRARNFNGEMTGFIPLGQISPTQQAFNPYFSPVLSFSGFKSDQLTQFAESLMHEVDPSKQKQVYTNWSDYVLDEAWASTIATSPPLAAISPKLHDLMYTIVERLDYTGAWLDA